MKFFISHSSQHKPTIKEVLKLLPVKITPWIDEDQLIWGSDLTLSLSDAIKSKTDYVILFISESSSKSSWVQKEVKWTLEEEKKMKRNIILPILIQSGDEDGLSFFPELRDRKILILNDFTDHGLKKFADVFANHLFNFVASELDEIHSPKNVNLLKTLDNAETLILEYSRDIQTAIFPYRENNPITFEKLYELIINDKDHKISQDDFLKVFSQIQGRCLIPGLYFDGYEVYLEEEHMLWKNQIAREKKLIIARKAASLIKNDMTVYIDAGSTTSEVINIICNRIDSKNLSRINILTISIDHANKISEYSVRKGFDDNQQSIRLFLLSGRVRLNTSATVPIDKDDIELKILYKYLNKIDLAILGVNGATEEGFSTSDNTEFIRKKALFGLAEQSILLCDDTKCGIKLSSLIAKKEDNFKVIMNQSENIEAIKVINAFQKQAILVGDLHE